MTRINEMNTGFLKFSAAEEAMRRACCRVEISEAHIVIISALEYTSSVLLPPTRNTQTPDSPYFLVGT